MKKNYLLNLLILFVLGLGISFYGCEGPMGPAGADGIDGVNGVDGQDGEDGNANVTSQSFTASWSMDWTNYFWYCDLYCSDITNNVLETGVVLVYARVQNTYRQLPFVYYTTDDTPIYVNPLFITGMVEVQVRLADGYYLTTQPSFNQLRVVTIPAPELNKYPEIDLSDYEAVAKTFNLDK